MTDLSLPGGWTERAFERGEYRGEPGLHATLTTDEEDATLSVLPVRYERVDGRDRIDGLDSDFEHRSGTVGPHGPTDVSPRTAHVLRAQFATTARDRDVVYAVTASPDDAFAVACHLARAADDGETVADRVVDHGGSGVGPTGATALSDDEVADATFADRPERCLFTGKPTSSHGLSVPLRYAVGAGGYPHTDAGVPRVPTLVARFDALVSHGAWTDQSLASFDPTAPVERDGPGEYTLPDADALADGDAERLALVRHGEDD